MNKQKAQEILREILIDDLAEGAGVVGALEALGLLDAVLAAIPRQHVTATFTPADIAEKQNDAADAYADEQWQQYDGEYTDELQDGWLEEGHKLHDARVHAEQLALFKRAAAEYARRHNYIVTVREADEQLPEDDHSIEVWDMASDMEVQP